MNRSNIKPKFRLGSFLNIAGEKGSEKRLEPLHSPNVADQQSIVEDRMG